MMSCIRHERLQQKYSENITVICVNICFLHSADVSEPSMCDLSGARTVKDAYAQHPALPLLHRRVAERFQSRKSSCHSTRPPFSCAVRHGEKPGPDKYETKTPRDPPVINRSVHSSCEEEEDERPRKTIPEPTGTCERLIRKGPSQSQRYEQNTSHDWVLTSRCDCSWQRWRF